MRSAPWFQQSMCPSAPTRKTAYSFASIASRSKRSPISWEERRTASSAVMVPTFLRTDPTLATGQEHPCCGWADWLGVRQIDWVDGQIRKEGHPAKLRCRGSLYKVDDGKPDNK